MAWFAGPARAGDGKNALQLLPDNTALVMTLDMKRIRSSATGKRLLDALLETPDLAEAARALKDVARFDLGRDLETIVIGMADDFERSEHIAVIAEGRFNEVGIVSMARKTATTFVERKHRGIGYYLVNGDTALGFFGGFAVMATKEAMPRVIDVHRRRARSATSNKTLSALVKAADVRSDMWFVFAIPKMLRREIAKETGGHGVDAAMASIDLSSGIRVRARMNLSSKAAAKAIEALARQRMKQMAGDDDLKALGLGGPLGRAKIKRYGFLLELDIEVSLKELGDVERALGALLQ